VYGVLISWGSCIHTMHAATFVGAMMHLGSAVPYTFGCWG
jgi:hypothetical protein